MTRLLVIFLLAFLVSLLAASGSSNSLVEPALQKVENVRLILSDQGLDPDEK